MQLQKIYLPIVLLVAVLSFSCVKETNDNLDKNEKYYLNNPSAISQVKFIHAYTPLTINTLTTSSVGFRITMDGTKINGAQNNSTSTNTLMYGGLFPPTIAYSFLPPGPKNFKFILNRITSNTFAPVAGDEVFNATVGLTAGKKYSMFIADPYASPNVYMVEDNFVEPNRDFFGLRFINLCDDAASRFDLVSYRLGNLFTNVGYKEMKDYVYLGVPATTDTVLLRLAGTTTVVSQVNGFLPGTQKVYTFYARGKTGVSGRTPSLTSYTNR